MTKCSTSPTSQHSSNKTSPKKLKNPSRTRHNPSRHASHCHGQRILMLPKSNARHLSHSKRQKNRLPRVTCNSRKVSQASTTTKLLKRQTPAWIWTKSTTVDVRSNTDGCSDRCVRPV